MGSELIRMGESLPNYIWSAFSNLNNPDLVYNIHKENIKSGASYLTANTFRTTQRSFKNAGISNAEAKNIAYKSMEIAVNLAKRAAEPNTKILGSIAPLEDCYSPNLFPGSKIAKKEFRQIGRWLTEQYVDILILETMNSINETVCCLESIYDLDVPTWVSFAINQKMELISGESLEDAIETIKDFNIDAILVNCSKIDDTYKAIPILSNSCNSLEWGLYPNLGLGDISPNGDIANIHSNDTFVELMNSAIMSNVNILGACCGSSTKHVNLISSLLNN